VTRLRPLDGVERMVSSSSILYTSTGNLCQASCVEKCIAVQVVLAIFKLQLLRLLSAVDGTVEGLSQILECYLLFYIALKITASLNLTLVLQSYFGLMLALLRFMIGWVYVYAIRSWSSCLRN
jgi:hypothetical protein